MRFRLVILILTILSLHWSLAQQQNTVRREDHRRIAQDLVEQHAHPAPVEGKRIGRV